MCAKSKELERSHRFEVMEWSRVNRESHVPSFVPMGEDEVYRNFPNLFASREVLAQALQMAKTWPFETIVEA